MIMKVSNYVSLPPFSSFYSNIFECIIFNMATSTNLEDLFYIFSFMALLCAFEMVPTGIGSIFLIYLSIYLFPNSIIYHMLIFSSLHSNYSQHSITKKKDSIRSSIKSFIISIRLFI